MYKSFFEANGIPEALVISTFGILAILLFASLFPGVKLGSRELPSLTRLGRILAFVIAASGLTLGFLAFQPNWVSEAERRERVPFCFLDTVNLGSEKFSVYWKTDSKYPAVAFVSRDGVHLSEELEGQADFGFQGKEAFSKFELFSRNRYGSCLAVQIAWNEKWALPTRLRCAITSSQVPASLKPGEKYEVSWAVEGQAEYIAFINGQEVGPTGSREFLFVGPNYDRFSLKVNSFGQTCEADLLVYASNFDKSLN